MSKDVNVLVLTGYGLNCDNETAHALELAGATAQRVHINALIDGSVRLDGFQIMVSPQAAAMVPVLVRRALSEIADADR